MITIRPLSERELEMVRLIASGNTIKESAFAMGIRFKTADCHVQRVHLKLRAQGIAARGIADVTRYAMANGLVEL